MQAVDPVKTLIFASFGHHSDLLKTILSLVSVTLVKRTAAILSFGSIALAALFFVPSAEAWVLTLTTLLLFAGIAAVAVWLLEIFILAGFPNGVGHLFYVGASAVVFSLLSMLSVIVTWTSAQYAGLAVFLFVALLSVLAWISVHLKWILGPRIPSRQSEIDRLDDQYRARKL
jgi:hypothetical protein